MQGQGVLSLGSAPGADRQLGCCSATVPTLRTPCIAVTQETFVSNMAPRVCVLFPVRARQCQSRGATMTGGCSLAATLSKDTQPLGTECISLCTCTPLHAG